MHSASLPHPQPRPLHQLHDVLALTLALGNVMNSGSKVRGHADGFHLGVLPQLMDIKATQATPTSVQTTPTITTLLHFIVSYFVKYKVHKVSVSNHCFTSHSASSPRSPSLSFQLLSTVIMFSVQG